MNLILSFCLLLTTPAHAGPPDRLMVAVTRLRDRVQFVDVSPEGRLVARGSTLTSIAGDVFGATMIGGVLRFRPLVRDLLSFAGAGSFVLLGVGSAMYGTGRLIQIAFPRPRLRIVDGRDFASAAGLNQFMRLSEEEQYRVANACPELATYLIKLDDAYLRLAAYGLR